MSIRVALIGCGYMAEQHAKTFEKIDGLYAAIYCDREIDRARLLLDTYGGSKATDSLDAVFSDDSIDAVYICTHHDSHVDLAVRASEAGKHIMMEKPLGLSTEPILKIGEAVDRSGVKFMTAFKLRFYPMVERAREYIKEPLITVAQGMDTRWPDDFWATDPVLGGGNLLSQGCHTMDLICYLNRSEPVEIFATGGSFTHPDNPNFDTMAATVTFENGRVASVAQGDCGLAPYVSKFSFQMFDGLRSVHLYDRLKRGEFSRGDATDSFVDLEELGVLRENEEFVRALEAGEDPPASFRDGLRATAMVLAAFDSIRTGTPQRIAVPV